VQRVLFSERELIAAYYVDFSYGEIDLEGGAVDGTAGTPSGLDAGVAALAGLQKKALPLSSTR
jgi:hypothetical protein